MKFVDVVLPLIMLSFGITAGYLNFRIFKYFVIRVASVALYGNGVQEIGLVRSRIQSLCCLVDQNVICRPGSNFVIFCNVHQLFAGEGIKSHLGENGCTSVEVTTVVVKCVCCVSEITKDVSSTFTGSIF